jgi:hypothetical protein
MNDAPVSTKASHLKLFEASALFSILIDAMILPMVLYPQEVIVTMNLGKTRAELPGSLAVRRDCGQSIFYRRCH